MVISFWWLTAIAGAALAAGFCMGRLLGEQGGDPKQENRRDGRKDSGIKFPFSVGSPVSGEVADRSDDGKLMAAIHPGEDRLYSPASGKITKIFPMGNGFLFRTEFGTELCIRVGDSEDDLLERYYRPRVVQNEIVGKGKLLLEFDRKGLVKEGASCCVTVTVETGACAGSLLAAPGERVRTGEPVLGLRPALGEECREALYG
ncbi:MAG: PTS glucose transporter subunit IIA [Firmicutes bacterium]|nr:PTS glucose transporter subunit IIA [Bacillota bacterium]